MKTETVTVMECSINGTPATWPPAVWQLWNTHADACDPKLTVLTVKSANYFTPRPYRNEYDRGSGEEGFVYTVSRPIRVCQIIIARHPIALDSPEHPFEPVPHQTGCARCGYAKGHHPDAATQRRERRAEHREMQRVHPEDY